VTRAGSEKRLGAEFNKQLFGNAEPLGLAGGILIALALFPGLPTIPFLALGGLAGTAAWRMRNKAPVESAEPAAQAAAPAKENFDTLLRVDPISIEVGIGLAYLASGGANSPLLQKIAAIRRHFASTMGFVFPPVRVTDNVALRAREYLMLIKGGEAGRYELLNGCELAVPTAKAQPLDGQSTREPAFGLNAVWVPADKTEQARRSGYTVVDAINVLGTHLTELMRRNAHEIFSRQDAKAFCDRVAQDSPKTVEDLVPKLLPLSSVQKVLQNLLREAVPIRDGVSILEALGEAAQSTKNTTLLTEYVRQNIRRTLVKPYLSPTGELRVYFTDLGVEQMVEGTVEHGEQNSVAALAPQMMRDIVGKLQQKIDRPETPFVVVTSAGARPFLRQLVEPVLPNVFFLSHNEVPAGVRIVSAGVMQ
jgi:flagellar biosynthesis protein FlhA